MTGTSDASRKAICWSPGSVPMVGSHLGEGFHVYTDRFHPEDAEVLRTALAEVVANPGLVVHALGRMALTDDEMRWLQLTAANALDDPDVAGLIFNATDVSAHVELETRLRDAATHDPLTGLPNRTYVLDHLRAAMADAHPAAIAVLFLDLDRFKV